MFAATTASPSVGASISETLFIPGRKRLDASPQLGSLQLRNTAFKCSPTASSQQAGHGRSEWLQGAAVFVGVEADVRKRPKATVRRRPNYFRSTPESRH